MPIDVLLPLVTSPRELAAEDATSKRTSAGIQSAEIALSMLSAMAHAGGAHTVSKLGRQLGMPCAKVHRCLVPLERMGSVEQDPTSARYQLGAQALQMGLPMLSDVDLVRESSNLLPKLTERLNEGVFLSIWTVCGPIIVCWEGNGRPVAVSVRVESVMPLLSSATGQIYAAWVPEVQIASLIDRELHGSGAGKTDLTDWLNCRAHWQVVQQGGMACIGGTLVHGTDLVAVPILGS